jgi:hypothetical protein
MIDMSSPKEVEAIRTFLSRLSERAVRMDGHRAAAEGVPRDASFVFAPADPLLIRYARSWSLSEPYLIRAKLVAPLSDGGGLARGGQLPLEAVDERLGEVIRMGGPQLPGFLH